MVVLDEFSRQANRLELISPKSLPKSPAVLKDIWNYNNNAVEIFLLDSGLHADASSRPWEKLGCDLTWGLPHVHTSRERLFEACPRPG